jgi:tRNA(fMet)-specific endonuclease VapC
MRSFQQSLSYLSSRSSFDALPARHQHRLRPGPQSARPCDATVREVGDTRVCTSIIVAAELRYGGAKSRSPRLTAQLEAVLSALEVLSFDAPAGASYGLLRARLEQAGQPIGGNDLLIAAPGHFATPYLRHSNEREFARIDELSLENWLRHG